MPSRTGLHILVFAVLLASLPQGPCYGQTGWKDSEKDIYMRLQFLGEAALTARRPNGPPKQPNANETVKEDRLSWRVHLLPYIGEPELYEEFHLDEAWDSPHNKSLIEKMPKVYQTESSGFKTRIQMFSGKKTSFGNPQPDLDVVAQGPLDSRILIAVTDEDQAVTWTGPDQLNTDRGNPFDVLGKPSTIYCVTRDCQVLALPKGHASKLAGYISPATGEKLDFAAYRAENNQVISKEFEQQRADARKQGIQLNSMKKIWSALREYDQRFHSYPVSPSNKVWFNQDMTPKLSWRVHLLPFLNEQKLHQQFKFDEAWDSEHNRALLSQMPAIYRDNTDPADSTTTRIQMIVGSKTLFAAEKPPRFRELEVSNCTVLIRTGASAAVPWTKPADAEFIDGQPKKLLGDLSDWILSITSSGSQSALKLEIPDELFRAQILPASTEGTRKPLENDLAPWNAR